MIIEYRFAPLMVLIACYVDNGSIKQPEKQLRTVSSVRCRAVEAKSKRTFDMTLPDVAEFPRDNQYSSDKERLAYEDIMVGDSDPSHGSFLWFVNPQSPNWIGHERVGGPNGTQRNDELLVISPPRSPDFSLTIYDVRDGRQLKFSIKKGQGLTCDPAVRPNSLNRGRPADAVPMSASF